MPRSPDSSYAMSTKSGKEQDDSSSDEGVSEANLRYTNGNERVNISGWLVKEGKNFKRQKARFLKLQGSQLSNHKSPASNPSWTLSIVDSTVGPGTRKNELLVELPKRKMSFFTETTSDYERWMFALKKASARNFKLESFYGIGDVVGEGVNGNVHIGWDKVTREEVAIKSIPYEGDMSAEDDAAAEEEIRIVKSLQHEKLVRTYDVFRDPSRMKMYIVMEFVRGGELFSRVAHEKGNLVTEGDAIRVSRDILEGIIYMHSRNMVHRDVKLENILCLDADETKPIHVKLADFGLSSRLKGRHPTLSSHVGTSFYIAPEIIRKQNYDASVDMWACGVVIYIMLSGQFPFCGDTDEEYYQNVLEQELDFPDSEWATVSEEAKDLIRGLLEKNPEKRLTANEAIQHKWLASGSQNLTGDLNAGSTDNEEEEYQDIAPKSIFGKRRRTPAEILAKVRQQGSEALE